MHRLAERVRFAVGFVSPVPTRSQFVERGTLTPTEFEEAGDQLTFKFPTWQWQSSDPKRRVGWLPPDKQFLITRNVPCRSRVRDVDLALATGTRSECDDWFMPGDLHADVVEDFPIGTSPVSHDSNDAAAELDKLNRKSEEPAELMGLAELDNLLAVETANSPATCGMHMGDIIRTRTYDLSITYDKFYQTPRLWLFGYDEYGIPLNPSDVFEDVLSDYVSKTVTVDPHPCNGVPTVSIHPCKHAAVMRRVVAHWLREGIAPRHDLAIFVLLKFIGSVIPTIDYDFTVDISMRVGALPTEEDDEDYDLVEE